MLNFISNNSKSKNILWACILAGSILVVIFVISWVYKPKDVTKMSYYAELTSLVEGFLRETAEEKTTSPNQM